MGLSSKQVSGDGFDWTQNLLESGGLEFSKHPPLMMQQQQQQQQQLTPVKCPRCDSTNTKFCYYNNYNRSQPRHFCKSCRRHWTKGGTLRNVPVGGGRKNKRLKTTTTTKDNNNKKKTSIDSINNSESRSSNFTTQLQHQQQQQKLQEDIKVSSGDHQKNISEFLYQSLINPTSFTEPADFVNKNSFVGSTDLSSSPIPSFQFTNLSTYENHPSSISSSLTGGFHSSSNVFNHSGGDSHESVENITNMNPPTTTMLMQMPWQVPNNSTSNFMDSSINWSWEDLNTFISTTDLKQTWEDDDQIKQ